VMWILALLTERNFDRLLEFFLTKKCMSVLGPSYFPLLNICGGGY